MEADEWGRCRTSHSTGTSCWTEEERTSCSLRSVVITKSASKDGAAAPRCVCVPAVVYVRWAGGETLLVSDPPPDPPRICTYIRT